MIDTTNDIEELLQYCFHTDSHSWHAALTALIAERDALKQERDEIANDLKWLRLESRPHADRDRELRERLVCAALAAVCIQEWSSNEAMADFAVSAADATLAAMRKGVARE